MKRAAGRSAASARSRAGLTLIELLLVMAILSLVLGSGVGILSSIDPGHRQAVGLVKNTLRAAQNTAMARRTPTSVRLDRENRTLVPWAWRVVGTWRFEDASLAGAFGLAGTQVGGRIVDEGYIGKGLSFLGEPTGSLAVFDVEDRAAFDIFDGFSLECALLREGEANFRVLNLGNSCGIDLLSGGAVRGWFIPAIPRDSGTGFTRGAPVVAESATAAVPAGRWVRLRVDYDRRVLRVTVDGLEVAQRLEEVGVQPLSGPLTISEERTRFEGVIDGLVVRALSREGSAELPQGVEFGPECADAVFFDSGGGLDRRQHAAPAVFELLHEDGRQERIQVGMYGTVEDDT